MGAARRTPLWAIAVTAVVAALVATGLTWAFKGGGGSRSCSGAIRLRMDVSQDSVGLLQRAAQSYGGNHAVDGTCVSVTVDSKNSGTAMQALARGWKEAADGPRPDIWSPASSVWVTLLGQRAATGEPAPVGPGKPEPIMTSPLTIAMPKPMADALGAQGRAIGWNDLAALAKDPSGWARYGHPEWGAFKLGKTNPTLSTSGLNATVGAYFAATGTTSDLTSADIGNPRNQAFVRDLERSIVHYGDTTLTFLSALQRADDEGRALSYISAVTVEEDSVWAYNQGDPTGDPARLHQHAKPRTPLVAIYPAEGTIYSDHPFVPLTWMGPQKRKAADDFLAYLHSAPVQADFQQFGYRDWKQHPGSEISAANGLKPGQPKTTLSLPSANGLSSMLDAWSVLRKPARVLFALDRSGSMLDVVPGTGKTKADLAKAAAIQAMDAFGGQDEVGLWMFAARLRGEQDWQELQPIARMDPGHRAALKQSLHDLTVDGGTGLYDTTWDAFNTIKTGSAPGTIQSVVVLTDGMNERTGGLDLETLLGRLSHQSGEPVRVFTVAYGGDADRDVLRKIAQATDAAEYDSSDPNSIQEVLTEVVSNF